MKKVTVFSQAKDRKKMLIALQKAGVLHVSDMVKRSPEVDKIDKKEQGYEEVLRVIESYQDKKVPVKQVSLSDEEFLHVHENLTSAISKEKLISDQMEKDRALYEAIAPWGAIDPEEIKSLGSLGVALHFYTLGKKEYATLCLDKSVFLIRLKDINKQIAIAVVGKPLDRTFPALELVLPDKSSAELAAEMENGKKTLAAIADSFKAALCYVDVYHHHMALSAQDGTFARVDATMTDCDGMVTYLTGYIPSVMEDSFKDLAKKQSWAYALSDPGPEDNPPTLVKYKGILRIMKPLFDLMGIVPGYREYDISLWFLMYFSLFFAMIIGDAGYGLIFLASAIVMQVKSKKCTDTNALLYVLSAATIIWGAVTGTWFGSKEILEALPFLKAVVIPSIANYPELFGVQADVAQNMVMKFCFLIGASQLSLACVLNVVHKIPQKNLSWVADCGWLLDLVVIYFLVLNLVIGAPCNMSVVFICVAFGFLLVCFFGGQAPGVPFGKGVLAGLGGFFTNFLNTFSCFSNIMSYIRLFAVGMASLAVAQSFNSMAADLLHGFALPAGLLIILLGHGLNLVMGLLSVLVHGVRLNLLEFSGQLSMEWSGYQYDPFKKTVNDNVVGNN